MFNKGDRVKIAPREALAGSLRTDHGSVVAIRERNPSEGCQCATCRNFDPNELFVEVSWDNGDVRLLHAYILENV